MIVPRFVSQSALTPQFFANTPRGRLCREGVPAAMVHRLKLGRTLDAVYT